MGRASLQAGGPAYVGRLVVESSNASMLLHVTPFCCSYMSFYNPFWVTKDVISKQVVIMTSGIYRHKAQAHTDGRAGNLWMPRGPAT